MCCKADCGVFGPGQLSCATCEICEEPPALEGVDVIVQAVPIGTDKVSIWYKSSVQIAGAQYDNICTGERGVGEETGAGSDGRRAGCVK